MTVMIEAIAIRRLWLVVWTCISSAYPSCTFLWSFARVGYVKKSRHDDQAMIWPRGMRKLASTFALVSAPRLDVFGPWDEDYWLAMLGDMAENRNQCREWCVACLENLSLLKINPKISINTHKVKQLFCYCLFFPLYSSTCEVPFKPCCDFTMVICKPVYIYIRFWWCSRVPLARWLLWSVVFRPLSIIQQCILFFFFAIFVLFSIACRGRYFFTICLSS